MDYGKQKIIKFILLLILFIVASCNTFPVDNSKDLAKKTFKHDLTVEINGKVFRGSGVVDRSPTYNITIYPTNKVNRLVVQTCHQELVFDNPETDGWFKKSVSLKLQNIPNVVDVMACSLEIVALSEKTRVNAFATIEFLDSREEVQLPALLKCNGSVDWFNNGVSICQSAEGLIQQINFPEPVIHKGSKQECDVMKSFDDKTFTFIMPKGKCTYYFGAQSKAKNGKRKLHRLQLIGYTEIPVR